MAETSLIHVTRVDSSLIKEVVRRILTVSDPDRIILFGSWAAGNAREGSDLDILVITGSNGLTRRQTASAVYRALAGILIPKDVVVATAEDIEQWQNVPQAVITTAVRTGTVIYEK